MHLQSHLRDVHILGGLKCRGARLTHTQPARRSYRLGAALGTPDALRIVAKSLPSLRQARVARLTGWIDWVSRGREVKQNEGFDWQMQESNVVPLCAVD